MTHFVRFAGVRHNASNALLREGLEAAGLHVGEIPRNCADSEFCGHCCFGCAAGHKQVLRWILSL